MGAVSQSSLETIGISIKILFFFRFCPKFYYPTLLSLTLYRHTRPISKQNIICHKITLRGKTTALILFYEEITSN